jgi:ADP-ribose pyrophosphatase
MLKGRPAGRPLMLVENLARASGRRPPYDCHFHAPQGAPQGQRASPILDPESWILYPAFWILYARGGDMEYKNPETAVMSHKEVYRGKIVSLQVDTIRQKSGGTTIREVVLHPGGVTAVPILNDGRLLLIRQFRYPIGRYILELPAGKLDSGQSPVETVARELEEETGYRAGFLNHECTFYTTPGISNEAIHLFIARDLSQSAQDLEEGEHITVEAYSLEECLRKIENGEISDGKTILGILWYQAKFVLKSGDRAADK